jgi:hypothetical protein
MTSTPLFDGPVGTAVRRILAGKIPADLDAVIADCWRCQHDWCGCWHKTARLLLDHGLRVGDVSITNDDDPQLSMFSEGGS